ncbi:unnamed protein product, partial [Rotaria magnacalcarata]
KIAVVSTPFFKSKKSSERTCKVNLKPSTDENKCGSLYQRLPICVGSKVLIGRNIDQDNFVVNGTDATVTEIVWEDPRDFITTSLRTDDLFSELSNVINTKLPKYVELKLYNGQIYKLEPQEARFNDMDSINMTRLQLPLALGYAITIHRTQCMTYSKLVVDLGGRYWKPGMFYTVFSRTGRITDIILLAYDRKSFKTSVEGLKEIERLQIMEKERPLRIDDFLCETIQNVTPDANIDYDFDLNNIEREIENPHHELEHTIKRIKMTTDNNLNNVFDNRDNTINPEDVIVCERQYRLFCGRRALLATELATQELITREDVHTLRDVYFNKSNGYYNIQVIKNALQLQCNIELIQLDGRNVITNSENSFIRNHIFDVQALFIQQADHYFCARRFDNCPDHFFLINSLTYDKHKKIQRNRINDYIDYLHEHDSCVYVPVCANIIKWKLYHLI